MAFRSLIRAGNTILKEKLMMNSKTLQNAPYAYRYLWTTTTVPKQRAYSPTAAEQMSRQTTHNQTNKQNKEGAGGGATGSGHQKGKDYVPVYVSLGLIALAVAFGVHTMKQQLMHSPAVNLKKSKRETMPEVEVPEQAADEADKFVKKSFFRKVAHVQEFDHAVPDTMRGDVLARKPRVESLKSVGVDPKTET